MNRAEFCCRMMPALRLAAKQGYLRNDARTRELLGYDLGVAGCKHLSNRLCEYTRQGLMLATSTGGGRRMFRITTRGRLAIDSNAQHAQRHTISARLADYFERNRDEELSIDDVCVKFACTLKQARRAVEYLVTRGIAERVNVVRATRPALAQRRSA